jgi:choline-sulfatase
MGDHHRHDALGGIGNPLARTPNLSKLARNGMRFTHCFTQSPVCAPARHSLATGQYAHTHGVITNEHMPHPGMRTIAHALQPLGYRRFNIGHMHWKDREMDTGYEPWITHETWREAMPESVLRRYEWEHHNTTRRTTGGPGPRTREQYSGDYVARNAIRQMREAVENDEPFLCWAAFSEPHPPFYPPRDIYEMFDQGAMQLPGQAPADAPPPSEYILKKRREWAHLTHVEVRQILAGYYGMVHLLDGYVGMILDALDEMGIRDDTIVVWTSDHGDQMWEHEMFLKFCVYDGSVRVPLIVDVPGMDAGDCAEFAEHVDLLPTLCELAGAECPEDRHGCSLVPLLQGQPAPTEWRNAVFSQIGHVRMIRTSEWKLNTYDGKPGELFDLHNDPNEWRNRVLDPACRDVVQSLAGRLEEWNARHAS